MSNPIITSRTLSIVSSEAIQIATIEQEGISIQIGGGNRIANANIKAKIDGIITKLIIPIFEIKSINEQDEINGIAPIAISIDESGNKTILENIEIEKGIFISGIIINEIISAIA